LEDFILTLNFDRSTDNIIVHVPIELMPILKMRDEAVLSSYSALHGKH
jgi:hypothetical protein